MDYISSQAVASAYLAFTNLDGNVLLIHVGKLIIRTIFQRIVGGGCFDLSREVWHL